MPEMLTMTVYLDTVTDFPNGYVDDVLDHGGENLIDLDFPYDIVLNYYTENCIGDEGSQDFDDWVNNCYTADSTIDLYPYAKAHGFKPELPYVEEFLVEFTSGYPVFARDADEAVRIARERFDGEYYITVDGEYYT